MTRHVADSQPQDDRWRVDVWSCTVGRAARGQVLPSSPPNALLLAIKASWRHKKNRGGKCWTVRGCWSDSFLDTPYTGGSRSCCLWDSLSCYASSSRWIMLSSCQTQSHSKHLSCRLQSCHFDSFRTSSGQKRFHAWNVVFHPFTISISLWKAKRQEDRSSEQMSLQLGAQCRKAEMMILEESEICRCIIAWHLKCIMQCNAANCIRLYVLFLRFELIYELQIRTWLQHIIVTWLLV